MSKRWKYWCLNGSCGKKVLYSQSLKRYVCECCLNIYTREQLETIQNVHKSRYVRKNEGDGFENKLKSFFSIQKD